MRQFHRRWLTATDYIQVETPSKSKARCCRGVGVVTLSKLSALASLVWLWFFTTVARSFRGVWKLCTTAPSSVRLLEALRAALGLLRAGATMELRTLSAPALSWSSKSIGASARLRCHPT